MDPTIEVLTIYPAAWAALFQGLAEGLIYGVVGMATAAILATVLIVTLGSLRTCCRPDGSPLTLLPATTATDELPGIVRLAVVRQQRQRGRSA